MWTTALRSPTSAMVLVASLLACAAPRTGSNSTAPDAGTGTDGGADAGVACTGDLFAGATGSPFSFFRFADTSTNTDVFLGAVPSSVAAGDFNGDGKLDAAIASVHRPGVIIVLGDGQGGFSLKEGSPFATGNSPWALIAGDFDNDGKNDLVVTNWNAGSISMLLGNGSGGFAEADGSPVPVGMLPNSMVSGDFNGDRALDLAVVNLLDATVSVLLGNGHGGFSNAPGSPISVGSVSVQLPVPGFLVAPNSGGGGGADAVAAGDFNGDGRLDLAVTNADDSTVRVLLSDGSGGFSLAPGSPISVGQVPSSVAAGDFNSDGQLDLAVTNANDATVSVLQGEGTGRFANAPGSPIALGALQPEPSFIRVSDFNLDGKVDLALADFGNNSVSVLLGNGESAFSPAPGSPYSAGSEPRWVVTGDFNGDGQPDLLTADVGLGDSQNASMTLLLNQCR